MPPRSVRSLVQGDVAAIWISPVQKGRNINGLQLSGRLLSPVEPPCGRDINGLQLLRRIPSPIEPPFGLPGARTDRMGEELPVKLAIATPSYSARIDEWPPPNQPGRKSEFAIRISAG